MTPTDDSRPLRGSRILIVEDQSLLALDLALMIEDEGARVEGPIYRLEQAMAYDSLQRLDAAIIDVDIAGREVFPFADRLLASDVPIVFHTGRADVCTLHVRYPEAHVLPKPSAGPEILTALANAVTSQSAAGAATIVS